MKKLFLLLIFITLLNKGFSQPLSSYTFSAFSRTYVPVSGSFISYTGWTGGGGFWDDCWYNSIPIGFNFVYCGTTYTSLSASENCWVVLGQTLDATLYWTFNDDLSNTFGGYNLPRPILAALWIDV